MTKYSTSYDFSANDVSPDKFLQSIFFLIKGRVTSARQLKSVFDELSFSGDE